MIRYISIDCDRIIYYDEYDEQILENFAHSLSWNDESTAAIPLNVIFDNELITNEKQFYAAQEELQQYIDEYNLQ